MSERVPAAGADRITVLAQVDGSAAENRRCDRIVGARNPAIAATARVVARHYPDGLLIDIGTTTADVIPIAAGQVVAAGRTDPERLVLGELIYTGALRTPAESMGTQVPFGGAASRLSREAFALAGDVHVWRGDLEPSDYTVASPDGRPSSREFAGERLARLVCADRDMVDEDEISAIADSLARSQVLEVAAGVGQVLAANPTLRTAVVTGLGAFIAERAAREHGLDVVHLAARLGAAAARCAPAAAVALLGEQFLSASGQCPAD